MKITDIKVTHVNVPFDAPFWWTAGLYPGASKSIIEVETDAGIVGLGEAPWWHFGEVVEKEIKPALIGQDPLDLANAESLCVPAYQITANTGENASTVAFGAVELALWDIRGKAMDLPLYKLLGGAVRKAIPFTEYFSFRPAWRGQDGTATGGEMTPEAIVDYCLKMREQHGSTFFEGKLIQGDPELEIRTVRLLREALGPEAMIRLDSNMQWSLTTARWVLREIEAYNIRNYEDPVASFEEMAELRQHSRIPFSTHIPDLRRAVALGAPDSFVCNFAALGGIARTLKFVAACEAMGKGFWCYSNDLGIMTSAYLHVVAATHWITEPSQSLFRWQVGDVIKDGPFRQTNNVVHLPKGPGLGVDLDPAAMERWHRHFAENGPMSHFHDPAAPGRFRRLPLN
ncbi:mandelate racemase/muconate lactonizing enzyme family protein [Denitrobaculum tricleocarpae]|uniref:glucarate dehydratase n=1 Tax=Denitrobaculum tricleocarpae TaxID=2591009 RepID=A0A545TF55_9PROT|nr:mandelate racemase/muconate lactonizing enzyme family protein [Denitrobaculum tricleocarpae]TQV75867.1 chloromuconate cycloisomerase [Denitrobaculum tricleocarpae]